MTYKGVNGETSIRIYLEDQFTGDEFTRRDTAVTKDQFLQKMAALWDTWEKR